MWALHPYPSGSTILFLELFNLLGQLKTSLVIGVATAITTSPLLAVALGLPALGLTRSERAMVTSAHPLASQVGVAVLQRGGNAVDAAVATALMIAVVEPYGAGLGGGGFALVHLQNQPQQGGLVALDFRERAPRRSRPDMYLDAQGRPHPTASIDGHLAVAVPGTVAGLYELHRRYGKLPWATLFPEAIQAAEQGFTVGRRYVGFMQARQASFARNPAARAIFLRPERDAAPRTGTWQVGDRLVQTDLGKTLRAVAQNPQTFYRGWIARAIAKDMVAFGGIVTERDLANYRPTWRQPLCGTPGGVFQQYQICSMPPPSSGGVHVLQMLNLLVSRNFIPVLSNSRPNLVPWDRYSPDTLQLLAGVMQIAYADRARYLGDPDFNPVPVAALVNPIYARLRSPEIDLQRARTAQQVQAADPATLARFSQPEPEHTSHLSVVDTERNAVSLTFTVNTWFGAAVVTPGTGILLNNEMNDFTIDPGRNDGKVNTIAPWKIPRSSMTPVIVREQGQFRLAAGAPGGSTIITTVFQLLVNVYAYRMDAGQAMAAPRIHQQWLPDRLLVEQGQFSAPTLAELRRRGQPLEEREAWGNGNLILLNPNNQLEGATDPRGSGAALGY
jgi:gamma-glutamyltranspeptidase / glutathione hydrolase